MTEALQDLDAWRRALAAELGPEAGLTAYHALDAALFKGDLALRRFMPECGHAQQPAPPPPPPRAGRGVPPVAVSVWDAGRLYERALADAAAGPRSRGRGRGVGSFYTPAHIARDLVAGTLGGRSPGGLVILDPACGAGALLVEAQRYVLAAGIPAGEAVSQLRGVDVDAVAVALTRRCLYAGYVRAGAPPQRAWEAVLRCVVVGDALLDEPAETWRRVDAVIANPPYLFERSAGIPSSQKAALRARYRSASPQLATYPLFVERGLSLLRPGGRLGFVLPINHTTIPSMAPFRQLLIEGCAQLRWVRHRYQVFADAEVDTCLLFASRAGDGASARSLTVAASSGPGEINDVGEIPLELARPKRGFPLIIAGQPSLARALLQMEAHAVELGQVATVKTGLKAYEVGKGRPRQTAALKAERAYHAMSQASPEHRRFLRGRDVGRYHLGWSGQWLRYGPELAAPRSPSVFEGLRLLVRQIPARPPYAIRAALCENDEVHDVSVMVVAGLERGPLLRLLAVLCSAPMTAWFVGALDKLSRSTFPQFKARELMQFPVPEDLFSSDRPEALSLERAVKARLREGPSQGVARDAEIDALVCLLFGLEQKSHAVVQHP